MINTSIYQAAALKATGGIIPLSHYVHNSVLALQEKIQYTFASMSLD